MLGDPDLPHSFSYVPDIGRALVSVGEADDDAMGQAWNVPNAPDKTLREILTMFAEQVGEDLKIQSPPAFVLTLIGLVNANARELKEMLYQWQRPFRVDHSKFAARFWAEATPLEEGIAASADWYKQRDE